MYDKPVCDLFEPEHDGPRAIFNPEFIQSDETYQLDASNIFANSCTIVHTPDQIPRKWSSLENVFLKCNGHLSKKKMKGILNEIQQTREMHAWSF